MAGLIAIAMPAVAADVQLNLEFRDEAGQPLPVRAGVFAGTQPVSPPNPIDNVYQALGAYSHFCCNGSVQLTVPAGPVTIRAGRGFEFAARDSTLIISSPTTVTMTLRRIANMNGAGWYSGDTHVHITHQPQVYLLNAQHLLLAMKAEDLNYANSMEEPENFTGTVDPASLSNRVIHFSKEERNASFSHLSILGLRQWIGDQSCAETGIACGQTLDATIHWMVHSQTGPTAVIATHPLSTNNINDNSQWPGGGMWRGISIDLPAGAVDAMDLLNYTNAKPPAALTDYYEALNAGFRLAPSAGTDCTLARAVSAPLGGYRVYARVSGSFTMDSWITAFKAGRSFVSNYPLITHFDVQNAVSGDVLTTNRIKLRCDVSVVCALPMSKIEIIGDPGVLAVIQAPGGSAKSITAAVDIPRGGLTWVAARVTGILTGWHPVDAAGLFAQTAPVYLALPAGTSPRGAGGPRVMAALYFLERIDELEAYYDANGYFPSAESREAFDDAVASARDFYSDLLNPTDVSGASPHAAWLVSDVWPNPTEAGARIAYTVPPDGGAHTVAVYDAAGRVVRRLFDGTLPEGGHELEWDGRDAHGSQVASGVYFVKVSPRGAIPAARKLVLIH
ncbi:MAG TPA: CehA/McbA family metallohydrolase [Candidatus Krumholzibacteria bacterium]